MSIIPDGTYGIKLPMSDEFITDMGEGEILAVVQKGQVGNECQKIDVHYSNDKGAYSLKFNHSKKYVTFPAQLHMNTKLVTGEKPRYFKIVKHEHEKDVLNILAAENQDYFVGLATENLYPRWVALTSLPDKQGWSFKKV